MAKVKTSVIVQLAILVLAAVAAGVSCIWSHEIELKTGLLHEEEVILAEGISGSLSVYYVDVGQGDCTVISLPDGKTIIIDGGENNKKTETAIDSFIAETFTDFKYFDYAILTHPDSDHCGSLDYALEKYPARVSYRPNVEAVGTNANPTVDPGKADLSPGAVTKNTAAYAKCITAMYAENADFTPTVYVTDPADENQTISGGEGDDYYSLTFFSPLSKDYSNWNDYSPIMILEYRGFKFAMSGDAEKANETEFVAKVNAAKTDGVTDKYDIFTDDFCVNAIKTGHHGSSTSTSQEYIDVMTTKDGAKNVYYIISCGDGNSYGHPHSETLDKLDGMNVPEANILRTDKVGTITLTVKEDGEEGDGYALFYGNSKSDQAPGKPSQPSEPEEPTEPPETKTVYVYYKLGEIDITWPLVVWVAYAIFAVLVLSNLLVKPQAKRSGRKR